MMNEKWFGLQIDEIEKKLKTNAASGLSPKAARSRGHRSRAAGHLFYIPYKAPSRIVLEILSDFSLIILLLVAVFSLFFEVEEYMRGLIVFVAVLLNLIFSSVLYYRSQRTVESLASFFYPMAKVIRNGKLFRVDFRSVVVGDVILLERGDVICCDARLVNSDGLTVNMRVDRKNYVHLEKFATGHVDPKENRAKEMVNMVHAGSVIESGSARAIVTATGRYTYLGAMTGGIPLPVSDAQPKFLERLRKQCSRINMTTLILVLPFSMISLLLGHMVSGRESVLSAAFLTALSIAATTMSQLLCTLLKLFYVSRIRKLVVQNNSAVVKNVAAFDKLASADYIFMLDGCAATDGILHFGTATCAEGEIHNYSSMNKTARMLSEYVSIYYTAATRTLTTGVSASGDYLTGIREFIDKSGVDEGALKIRCSIISYATGNMTDTPEVVCFLDRGIKFYLNVSRSVNSIRECQSTLFGGNRQPLSAEGLNNLERIWKNLDSNGQIPLTFTVSSEHSSNKDVCFVGMIALREGVDPNLSKNIANLEKFGCKVISFVRENDSPKLPPQLVAAGCVSKDSFVRSDLPITYRFGKINSYSDLSSSDIITLISYAHSQKKSVVVIGFDESALDIAEKADGFVTCSPIDPHMSGYLNEEIRVSEVPGQQGSSSCIQTVKEKAHCLIPRPRSLSGGLASLVSVFYQIRSVYSNISDFLRYTVCVQIIRILIVALPMLFGDAILDARHVVICSYIFDVFVFFAFMLRQTRRRRGGEKNYCQVNKIKEYLMGDRPMLVSSVVSSLCAILLPVLADFLVGKYDYKAEVLFTSLLLLHLVSFFFIYYGNDLKAARYIYKNKMFIAGSAFAILIWTLSFTWDAFGVLLGIEGLMSPLYLVISILPALIFSIIFLIFTRMSRNTNSRV